MNETCQDCEGTGDGPCANCGDLSFECCCDEPDCEDCDACLGSGSTQEEEE